MNKKGFTLIELLAVIVILAVIALIATPVIMNAISNAKQGAWKDAAYGIIKATENAFAKGFSETTDQVDTFFLYENGVMTSYPSGKTIDYKGSVPQDGGIVLHSDGSVTLAIHDGSNCAVKAKSAGTVTVTTTDKATCISNIYYKQTTAPFNTLLTNGDFSNGTTGWSAFNGTINNSNGTLVSKASLLYGGSGQFIANYTNYKLHKLYFSALVKSDTTSFFALLNDGVNQTLLSYTNINSFQKLSSIRTIEQNATTLFFKIQDQRNSLWTNIYVDDVYVIDLTTTYGAGNEPTVSQMDNNLNKVWIDSSTNTLKRFTAAGWINF